MSLNLKNLTDSILIHETKSLVGREREITSSILHYLSEIQGRNLYSEYGYSSLFMFCTKHLGYSESQAQRRIEAMKAIRDLPELEEKIKTGSLTLTAVAKAQIFIRHNKVKSEEKLEIFESLENKSTRECERTLLSLTPDAPLPKDKVRVVSETHTQLSVTLSKEVMEKLEKLKALLSHKNPHMTQAELLEVALNAALEKHDLEKRKDRKASAKPTSPQRNALSAPQVRTYIPVSVKKAVWVKNKGECSFISTTGTKCSSKYFLETDHIVPIALGGGSNPENLRLLCRTHNQLEARRKLGKEFMRKFTPTLSSPLRSPPQFKT